jgi:DNA-binding phage protein
MLTEGSFTSNSSIGAAALRQSLRSAVEGSSLPKQIIAERAGISRRALYSLLEGQADPRLSTVEALAHVLGMDLFAAPKAVHALRLSSPSKDHLSRHSRVRRLLEQHNTSNVSR